MQIEYFYVAHFCCLWYINGVGISFFTGEWGSPTLFNCMVQKSIAKRRLLLTKTEKAIETLAEPIVSENGYEYVGTEIKKAGGRTELIIYADKPGGMMLEDCEKISKLIDPVIDAHDPIEESYFLCVSSPGLDRPLKEPRDFKRSIGKKVDVKLYRAIDGSKQITGVLGGYDDNGFRLEDGAAFAFKDVAVVRLHVDI